MIFREIITASSREKAPSVWDGCGAAVRFAVVKPGEKALDLGTGTGINPHSFRKQKQKEGTYRP